MRRRTVAAPLAVLATLLLVVTARAQSVVFAPNGLALQGYDAVGYFTEGRALRGDPKHSYFWQGTTWFFANQRNRIAFAGGPEKFQPQFGGYDALGMASGNTEDSDPSQFTLKDGRLLLFKNGERRGAWNIEHGTNLQKALGHWPRVRAGLAARQAERERSDAAECEELFRIKRSQRDFAPVIARCRPLAEQGDLRALEITAQIYDTRNTPFYNPADAVEFYRRAAEKGSRQAQYESAQHYLFGRGVAKNPKQAVIWFERAADQGDQLSMRELGRLHRDGSNGVEKDLVTAYMWFNLGALRGDDAATERDRLKPLLKPDQILEAEARSIRRLTGARSTGPNLR
jgi:YHS domain-containing protein